MNLLLVSVCLCTAATYVGHGGAAPRPLNHSEVCKGSSCNRTATPGSKNSVKGFVIV